MGFFSGLKKVFNPGGAVLSKVINDGRDYQGVLDYAMNGQKQAEKNQAAQKAAQQSMYNPKPAFSPDPGLNPQAMKLGWTSGGYRYNNNPFSLGGGQQLPQLPSGGSMPPAGAQPPQMGPPTMHIPQNPQLVQAQMLRNRMGS